MELEQVQVGQRVRVNYPGVGDHGQVGTVKDVQDGRCHVHLDWDERPQHTAWFYAEQLDLVPDAPTSAR